MRIFDVVDVVSWYTVLTTVNGTLHVALRNSGYACGAIVTLPAARLSVRVAEVALVISRYNCVVRFGHRPALPMIDL